MIEKKKTKKKTNFLIEMPIEFIIASRFLTLCIVLVSDSHSCYLIFSHRVGHLIAQLRFIKKSDLKVFNRHTLSLPPYISYSLA